MVPAPPPLPTRFPCWVRAIYSWGGESKRDLGFIEGDLIECLNAGDGSWWTGRLWRDRRAIGVFPSNFVEVLPETFRPTSRSTSPLPASNTPSPKTSPQKSKTFRKPFEAYSKAPHYTTGKIPETYKDGVRPQRRDDSYNSIGSAREIAAMAAAATPPQLKTFHPNNSREAYKTQPFHGSHPTHGSHGSRDYVSQAPSPASSSRIQACRPPTQATMPNGGESPPPPPPPPHRHAVSRHEHVISYHNRAPDHLARHGSVASYDYRFSDDSRHGPNGSYNRVQAGPVGRHNSNASFNPPVRDHMTDLSIGPFNHQMPAPLSRHGSHASYDPRPTSYHTPRASSPCPPSPGIDGLTPSPLREAMDDVMEQLDALGGGQESHSPEPPVEPFDPWSPESFDMLHPRSRRKHQPLRPQSGLGLRPQTSMGLGQRDEGYETYSGSGASSRDQVQPKPYSEETHVPQLSHYVERIETRLRNMPQCSSSVIAHPDEIAPAPPKSSLYGRPKSSISPRPSTATTTESKLRNKKSAYELGRQMIGRTFTTKTNSTSASSGNRSNATTSSGVTESTTRSLMSGTSAGGISATSAGSLARKTRARAQSVLSLRDMDPDRPETPFTGVTYHSSHASVALPLKSPSGLADEAMGGLGGLVQPKGKKQNFIKRILESAKTGVASSRGSIAASGAGGTVLSSPINKSLPNGIHAISSGPLGGMGGRETPKELGLSSGIDWVQVRRDVNRSNSLSKNEKMERRDRCQMLDFPALDPAEELYGRIDGDEGADGMPVLEPRNYVALNLSQVDKNSRFITSLPPMSTATSLATTYVCRPYRSDVQRLRAIFTWVAEHILWEEDFDGQVDTRRILQTRRACAEEYAVLVLEMCAAVGLHCETVRGYLKTPGEILDPGITPRSNHWWNAVVVENEWRMMDCCLASPSNPQRPLYSSMGNASADPWWFLTRPSELCWTHIPEHQVQQHVCPPAAHEVLLHLPCACPPFFKHGLEMVDYNTSLTRIEDLEMVHIKFNVPADVEVAAEVEVRAFARDSDGDFFESGDIVKKRALAQAEWFNGVKRYTVKALLPGDEGTGVLKVYAGKRGLMHSIKDIPHPLACAVPIIHTGENPPYEFVTRHPTPHAQRHDIYVVQPQCQRLAMNNTFVFAIRQHPSSFGAGTTIPSTISEAGSPIPAMRPGSALSMISSSVQGSNPSTTSGAACSGAKKPAKLAIQTPGGKILRLMRKEERRGIGLAGCAGNIGDDECGDGGMWETIIKCSERGVWRGLVLADRTARWCVFAEWTCVG